MLRENRLLRDGRKYLLNVTGNIYVNKGTSSIYTYIYIYIYIYIRYIRYIRVNVYVYPEGNIRSNGR